MAMPVGGILPPITGHKLLEISNPQSLATHPCLQIRSLLLLLIFMYFSHIIIVVNYYKKEDIS